MLKRLALTAAALAVILVSTPAAQLRVSPVGERPDRETLQLLLRRLASSGTFMQTDAHPDDEDNGLLAMLGEGQGMRTTLVTATRGDGGQNEIGPELGQSLGVLRTEELLAVHRFDGAEQYFTRAIDFGYSFSVEESIQKWGHDEIVGDFVRQIRTIRPDVIVGFLCGGQGGGQHHEAAAKLSLEAFRAAADPQKYPEQIAQGLRPWQAVRHFCTDNSSFGPQAQPATDVLTTDVSGFDPLLGLTFAELGLEARSMHKCQGTSQLLLLPGDGRSSRRYKLQDQIELPPSGRLRGAAASAGQAANASEGLFAGIDTSLLGLRRFAGGRSAPALTTALQAIQQTITDARGSLEQRGPQAAVRPLAAGLRAVRALRSDLPHLLADGYEIDFRLAQKERQFQDALLVAAGVRLDALADDGVVIARQPVTVNVYAIAADRQAVQLRGVKLTGFEGDLGACGGPLTAAITCRGSVRIPENVHVSTPYWTPRIDSARYDFEPDVPFGVPFRPSPFHARFDLTVGGADVVVDRVVEYRYSNVLAGEKRSELLVSPLFNVRVEPDILVFPLSSLPPEGGSHKILNVTIGNNAKGAANVTVKLDAPAGWTIEPASAPVQFTREDEETTVKFAIDPPSGARAGEFALRASATSADGTSDSGYEIVEYPHIHRRHVVEPASTRVKVMDVKIAPGLKIGYVMGVGDRVPQAIEQLGAHVTYIDADMLASGDLSQFDEIVLGVRAYDRRQDLRAHNQRLISYVENGGTVLVQYQRTEFNQAQYGPYPARTSDARVTDENAPMEVLQPDDPVFNTPNKLGPETWAGWVQERGTYFLGQRDPRYVDLLRSRDPFPYNPEPKTGILVEARVGKGRWIYTGLGLWRQLPAGVDGAYRLMANLLSLGKAERGQ